MSAAEIKPRFYADNPRFDFLSGRDRYLFAVEKPKYRFNVIGAGTIGQEHIHVTTLEGRAAAHGVYDPNPGSVRAAKREYARYFEQAEQPARELHVYDSLRDACEDEAVDGLLICTPNHTHLEIVRAAAASGKHILLEKPMATTLADAREIAAIAAGHDAVFQIGLQYRYKAMYVEAAHEALERGSLGAIKTISMLEHRPPFLDKVGQWNKFRRYSGGALVEKCCHYFDLINLFAAAAPVEVYASGGQAVNFRGFRYDGEAADVIDNACVIIVYENGARAQFSLNMFCPNFYEELILCGDRGRLKACEEFDYFHDQHSTSRVEVEHGEDRASRSTSLAYASRIEQSGHHGATYYEHRAFVDQIEGKPANCADAAQGFWSVVVGVAAETSLREKRPVEIPALLAAAKVKPL